MNQRTSKLIRKYAVSNGGQWASEYTEMKHKWNATPRNLRHIVRERMEKEVKV